MVVVTDKSTLTISTFARSLLLSRGPLRREREPLIPIVGYASTLHVGTLVIEGAEDECLA